MREKLKDIAYINKGVFNSFVLNQKWYLILFGILGYFMFTFTVGFILYLLVITEDNKADEELKKEMDEFFEEVYKYRSNTFR